MREVYFILAAVHMVAVAVTGGLWVIIDLVPHSRLQPHLRDIRAVHFGSLYLVPWFLGLAYAFQVLQVPSWHQIIFPAGLGLLVFFSGVGYLFPRPPNLDPFYYWTRGWPLVLSMIGLGCLVVALLWTATVLMLFAANRPLPNSSIPQRTEVRMVKEPLGENPSCISVIRRAVVDPINKGTGYPTFEI
jgi:hypothetical protein